ncbi:MAG: hypothetical protein ACRDQW_16750 [Haloechinothrix sp.]
MTTLRSQAVASRAVGITTAVFALLVGQLVGRNLVSDNRPSALWSGSRQIHGVWVEHYDDLEQMLSHSDAVVLGHIQAVAPGRRFGDAQDSVHYGSATLRVHEALSNGADVDIGPTVQLELLLNSPSQVADMQTGLPSRTGVYFLRNKGLEYERDGATSDVVQANRPFYRLLNNQAILEDVDGEVWPPLAELYEFPANLAGTSFPDLVDEVRTK